MQHLHRDDKSHRDSHGQDTPYVRHTPKLSAWVRYARTKLVGHHKGARTSANWPVRKSSSRRAKRLCKANTHDVVGINAHSKTRVAAQKISHHDEQTVYTPSIKPLLTNGTKSRTNASTASRASSVAQQHHPAPQAAGHLAPQGAHWQVPRQVCIRPALVEACGVLPQSCPYSRASLSAVLQPRHSLCLFCVRTLLRLWKTPRIHASAPRLQIAAAAGCGNQTRADQ